MIGPSGAVKVMIATKPVDFRKGAEGLAALVKAQMGADPFSGTIYVFRAKRTDRIKLIFWDGSGVCLVVSYVASSTDVGQCTSRERQIRGRPLHSGDSNSPIRW